MILLSLYYQKKVGLKLLTLPKIVVFWTEPFSIIKELSLLTSKAVHIPPVPLTTFTYRV